VLRKRMVSHTQPILVSVSCRYYSLGSMSEGDRQQLVADHFLFKKGDRFLQSAGANRES
jgi:hypothetical protein